MKLLCASLVAAVAAGWMGGCPAVAAAAVAAAEVSPEETEEDIGDIAPATGSDVSSGQGFRFTLQGAVEYTSNAALSGNHGDGDVLFLPTAEAGYHLPLGKFFSLDAVARAENVLYADDVERAFFGFSGAVTFDFRLKESLPRLYVAAEPYWYQSLDTGDKIAASNGFVIGIDQGYPINRGLTLLFWGARFAGFVSSPSSDDRLQYRGMVGVVHQFQPSVFGQLYYAYQYLDYHRTGGRQDSRNIIGTSVTYQITDSVSATLAGNLIDNDSSNALADYQAATASLTFTWQF
jgi:hypothetical protein